MNHREAQEFVCIFYKYAVKKLLNSKATRLKVSSYIQNTLRLSHRYVNHKIVTLFYHVIFSPDNCTFTARHIIHKPAVRGILVVEN